MYTNARFYSLIVIYIEKMSSEIQLNIWHNVCTLQRNCFEKRNLSLVLNYHKVRPFPMCMWSPSSFILLNEKCLLYLLLQMIGISIYMLYIYMYFFFLPLGRSKDSLSSFFVSGPSLSSQNQGCIQICILIPPKMTQSVLASSALQMNAAFFIWV